MLFNTTAFVIFFVWFIVVFNFAARTRDQKLWFVTVASLLFYGSWNFRFVPLLVGTGLVDFYLAKRIHDNPSVRARKALLSLSVVMNLGVLGLFKYANFFIENAGYVLRAIGFAMPLPVLNVVLPVGISFYVFQSISYTVDVYRGVFEPRREAHEFIAGLTFFPHLVAGPIVRSSFLLPQFETFSPPPWQAVKRAFLLIAAGLCKKVIADHLASTVDFGFASSGPLSGLESWTSALAFSGQVYGDFSGYTDIATGVALLLGFALPPNFELPYLARSPVQFWHRWHISLSTWLRDYLWLPLSLRFPKNASLNLLITMVLAGLWHGAQWTFVLWGLFHGVLLVATHRIAARFPALANGASLPVVVRCGQVLLTFYLVTVGWVMFRAPTFSKMFSILRAMHSPSRLNVWTYEASLTLLLVCMALVVCHALSYLPKGGWGILQRPFVLWPTVSILLGGAIAFGGQGQTFIYFQF